MWAHGSVVTGLAAVRETHNGWECDIRSEHGQCFADADASIVSSEDILCYQPEYQ